MKVRLILAAAIAATSMQVYAADPEYTMLCAASAVIR
jgi:hypothetical protein